jgi:tetratricopeptide (TPR) repeat protein
MSRQLLSRYEEAMKDYESALKKNPSSVYSLYNIAVVMVRWKGLPDARSYVDKVRQALIPLLDTDKRESGLYGLGGLEALANNNEEALYYLQQAVLLGSNAVDWARDDIAWADLRSTDERFRALGQQRLEADQVFCEESLARLWLFLQYKGEGMDVPSVWVAFSVGVNLKARAVPWLPATARVARGRAPRLHIFSYAPRRCVDDGFTPSRPLRSLVTKNV